MSLPTTSDRRDPLLPNAGIVARREFRERVRSRLFVVSTALLAVLAIGVALAPLLVRVVDRGTVTRIAVASNDPALANRTIDFMGQLLNGGFAGPGSAGKTYTLNIVPSAEAARQQVEDGGLDAALVADRTPEGRIAFTLETGETVAADAAQLVAFGALSVAMVDYAQTQGAIGTRPFLLPTMSVQAGAGPTAGGVPLSSSEYASRRIVGVVFVVLIFITLVIYGMWVAAGVVAEKSSRVMELLISAASADQLVVGKIVGIGLAGLTQVLFVVVPAVAVLLFEDRLATAMLGPGNGIAPALTTLSPGLILAFLVYFTLGFVLYAAIYAAAGSLVSKPEDLQVIALPLSLVAIAGYLQAVLALTGGTAGFIRFSSLVPFWSPFVMLTRLSIGRVDPAELIVSLGLLAATAPLVVVLAIRVYRAGVLMYGQRPTWRTFIRAVRTAE